MTDAVNEYRGGARLLSFLPVVLISYAFIIAFVVIELEPADCRRRSSPRLDDCRLQPDLRAGMGDRRIVAAFLIGQLLDVSIFHRIRLVTGSG
jgi:hypothetical protein